MVKWGFEMVKKNSVAQMENNDTYMMYFNRLRDYAINMFEWQGMPPSVNQRFMELTLFTEGKILFFEDPRMGYLALPFTGGKLNVYNEYLDFRAVSTNYNEDYTTENAVPIWSNFSRIPILHIVTEFAKRLYWVERALDLNIRQQKFPFLILGEESQRLTLMNAYEKWEGNEPFIFGYKTGFDKEAFQVLNTPVPYVADKLLEYKHNLWNEAMTFLGIGNAKQDKKERLVSDEVAANDEQIQSSRLVMLKARQHACEQINEMFGLDVSVDFKLNLLDKETQQEDKNNEEF
jgi:hypothetical protein